MTTLLDYAIAFAQFCFVLAMMLAAIRVLRGPRAQDRILALDTFYVNGMMTLLALGIRSGSTMYFDVALLIALFGFAGSIALSKFVLRGEAIEP